jgi:hypothetical protein
MGNVNTYPLKNKTGQVFAFEIDRLLIGSRLISKVLRQIPGVTEIRVRRLFQRPFDIQAEFRFQDQQFMVWEPYADSSRYWIGPNTSDKEAIDISTIEMAFRDYRSRWSKLV